MPAAVGSTNGRRRALGRRRGIEARVKGCDARSASDPSAQITARVVRAAGAVVDLKRPELHENVRTAAVRRGGERQFAGLTPSSPWHFAQAAAASSRPHREVLRRSRRAAGTHPQGSARRLRRAGPACVMNAKATAPATDKAARAQGTYLVGGGSEEGGLSALAR